MRLQIARASRAVTARKVIGRCALAAVGAGFLAISTGTFGADLGTGYSTAIAVPSQTAPPSRRSLSAHPIIPPDAKPELAAQRAGSLISSTRRSCAGVRQGASRRQTMPRSRVPVEHSRQRLFQLWCK